jgi:Yip1 domain
MNIVERVKRLCVSPTTEWPIIAEEKPDTASLIAGYVLPLACLQAIAAFIGGSIVGGLLIGRTPLLAGISFALLTIVFAVIAVFVTAFIINALASTFAAEKNGRQALKLAAYSFTPAWVAGVFQILPLLGWLLAFVGALYGIYLLYLGLPRLMKCAEDKAVAYTAVVIVGVIVVSVVASTVSMAVVGAGMIGSGLLSGGIGGSSGSGATFDPDSPLGRLEALGDGLEKSAEKIQAAEKTGDQGAQAAAAFETIGTLFGGGKRFDPISLDQLKSFVPETLAGLPKQSSSAEKTGFGITVSKAEATYGDGAQKHMKLEILDTGGASGLVGVASWMGVQEEREDDDGYERTHQVGGRFVHERVSKRGGTNEFGIVLGERFVVSAEGRGVDIDDLRNAVSGLDLTRLESMKEAGAQK